MCKCYNVHACIFTKTNTHTHIYIHICIRTNRWERDYKHPQGHAHTHTQHARTHTKTPYTRTHTKHAQTYTNNYIHWSIADILYRGTSFKKRSVSWPAGEIQIEAAGWSLTASSSGGRSPRTNLCHPKISEAPTLRVWKSSSGRNLPLTRLSGWRNRRGSSGRRSPRRAIQGWSSLERG